MITTFCDFCQLVLFLKPMLRTFVSAEIIWVKDANFFKNRNIDPLWVGENNVPTHIVCIRDFSKGVSDTIPCVFDTGCITAH
jgi:hypothetical protein